ncbi:UNVERIFIED_CONTAM: hypothetical protein Sradi_3285400 [Sesamum radiatum]|uniref:Uncharacterized protein n=1 Tax=Sesamum radiatum TaxID=300843 RepID=A0AAW2R0Z5_SESRA
MKTQHLMPSVYLCRRAAFSKRAKCSTGSVVPSYSVMAGVRQFIGSSSDVTTSVKGNPFLSSSGAPPIWYCTFWRPF